MAPELFQVLDWQYLYLYEWHDETGGVHCAASGSDPSDNVESERVGVLVMDTSRPPLGFDEVPPGAQAFMLPKRLDTDQLIELCRLVGGVFARGYKTVEKIGRPVQPVNIHEHHLRQIKHVLRLPIAATQDDVLTLLYEIGKFDKRVDHRNFPLGFEPLRRTK